MSHTTGIETTLVPQTQPSGDWVNTRVVSWSKRCAHTCNQKTLNFNPTTVKSLVVHIPIQILSQDMDLALVFSNYRAARLLPHCLWDFAIDFLPGIMPPGSHIYPLSEVETQAMEEYMTEDLWQGFISKSTIVYLDDILIYSSCLTQHVVHVRQVLCHLNYGLYVKATRPSLHFSTITLVRAGWA